MRLATRYDPFERYGIDMKDALREKVRLAREDDERVLVLRGRSSPAELLELRTMRRARRALSADDDDGGYFDAHADVATFDLSADGIIERWRATGETVYGEGGDDEVPELAIRFAWSKRFKAAYVLNETDGAGTLRTRNGTYLSEN